MTTLVFELFGRDNSATRVFREVGDESDRTGQRLNNLGRSGGNAARSLNPLNVVLEGLRRNLVNNVMGMAKFVTGAGAVASVAITAAPFVARAATEVAAVAKASLAASPALLAVAAGGGLVLATFRQIGPKIGESLAPIPEMFRRAGAEASLLATAGIAPLAGEFSRANFPAVSAMMNSIATSTNRVVARFLEWGRSVSGVTAIRNLTEATSTAMGSLAPKISRVLEAFGNMIGRIAGVSLAAGSSGLGGVLDWLANRMDRVNAATVTAGLEKLRDTYHSVSSAVSTVVDVTQTATAFYREHRAELGLVADVLSVVAIAFGGPVVAIGAATSLIVRHWDDLKAAKASLQASMATPVAMGFMDDMRASTEAVVPALQGAWQSIWAAIGPVLTDIWNKIKNELIPAFGDFMAAIAPIVAFCIDVLGPVVAGVFQGIVTIISGAISIITGILNVFTAILTGDWSKLWEGIKQILSGAWDVIVGLLQSFLFGRILGLLGRVPGMFGGIFGSAGKAAMDAVAHMGGWVLRSLDDLVGRIPGALGTVVGLLYNAGKNIVQGLINGILSMIGAAGSAIGSVVSKIRASLPFSPAKEGPLAGAGSPDIAGRKIPAMIAAGMLGGLGQVAVAASRLAGATGLSLPRLPPLGALGAAGGLTGRGGAQGLVLDLRAGDTPLDQLLLEVLRKALRRAGLDAAVLGGV